MLESSPNHPLHPQSMEKLSSTKLVPGAQKVGDFWYIGISEGRSMQGGASQEALVVKNPPASAGAIRDLGSIPGRGRSPRGEHGSPVQYSCLENPMDRGAWWAAIQWVTKSWTRLKQLNMATCTMQRERECWECPSQR